MSQILNARIKINGDGELQEYMEQIQNKLKEIVPKYLLKLMFQHINITKEEFLTDPGRIYADKWYRRPDGRRYRPVLNYPRPKIGVLTGRLKQSYGATDGDGIREIMNNGFTIKVGTNVEYAEPLTRRKYDFAKEGLEEARDRYLDKYMNDILREIVND